MTFLYSIILISYNLIYFIFLFLFILHSYYLTLRPVANPTIKSGFTLK